MYVLYFFVVPHTYIVSSDIEQCYLYKLNSETTWWPAICPSTLFATNDISVLQNELNVIENHLPEQAQLHLSELDNGNISLANKLAQDYNLINLQKFFKLNSALVKMYEVKLN